MAVALAMSAKPLTALVVLICHWYSKAPVPPVGAVSSVSSAGSNVPQLLCAASMDPGDVTLSQTATHVGDVTDRGILHAAPVNEATVTLKDRLVPSGTPVIVKLPAAVLSGLLLRVTVPALGVMV